MKKLLNFIYVFVILGALSLSLVPMNSEIVVKHHSYTSYYDVVSREPDSVSWNLTPQMCACTPQARKDAFAEDPKIPNSATPKDYLNSGYDKGHLFSYDDAMCDPTDKVECFLMSNMLPQIHPFNAGDWKTLEVQERVWAKTKTLHIVAGGYGSIGTLKSGEVIPAYMWKAILTNGKYSIWIMPNKASSTGNRGLTANKFNAWLSPVLHTFDLVSIANEIKREKI